jgi:hypothetical protein
MKTTFLGFFRDPADRRAEAQSAANGNAAAARPSALRNCLRFVVWFSLVIAITFIQTLFKNVHFTEDFDIIAKTKESVSAKYCAKKGA